MKIEIFTDGSTSPKNPGYGGAASVILFKESILIRAEHISRRVTNNQSELYAIKHALEDYLSNIGDLEAELILYSDSKYSLGVVGGQYRPRKNKRLVQEIHKYRDMFPNLRLFWIRAHRNINSSKDPEVRKRIRWNDVVDKIAGKAAKIAREYSFSEVMPISSFEEKYMKIETETQSQTWDPKKDLSET